MSDLLAILNPYKWIAAAVLIAALAIGIPLAKHHYDATQQKVGYDKRAAEDKAASDAQTARNLDLQRAAEKNYVVKRDTQDHYFTVTTKEIIHDAALPACAPLPDPVRLRINAAIECAVSDSAAACGAPAEVPGAAEAAGHGGAK